MTPEDDQQLLTRLCPPETGEALSARAMVAALDALETAQRPAATRPDPIGRPPDGATRDECVVGTRWQDPAGPGSVYLCVICAERHLPYYDYPPAWAVLGDIDGHERCEECSAYIAGADAPTQIMDALEPADAWRPLLDYLLRDLYGNAMLHQEGAPPDGRIALRPEDRTRAEMILTLGLLPAAKGGRP